MLRALHPTIIVVLYTAPELTLTRINANAQGRPVPTLYEASFHNDLEATVALIYGIELGLPAYFLDAAAPTDALVAEVFARMS